MPIEPIDDPADPRVADYRDIQDAALRARRGLFVAESRAVVRALLASSRFRTRSIMLTAPALDGLRDALQDDVPVYLASRDVARAVVGYPFHRGCLALGERGVEPDIDSIVNRPDAGLVVALEDVSNPDNVGAVFRNARAFGADAIVLSAGCADPLYRKAIRTSMGASLITPFARAPDWAEGVARLRQAGYGLVALTPDPSALDIARLADRPLPSRVALILGAEGPGLRAQTRSAADVEVRIAMALSVDSLNVATAAAIALHWLRSMTARTAR